MESDTLTSIEQPKPVLSTPGSPSRLLWRLSMFGLGAVIFSVSLFLWQATHYQSQLSGRIVALMDTNVMIVDAKGLVTTLHITPETTIHLPKKLRTDSFGTRPPTNAVTNLSIGQFVYVFGTQTEAGDFTAADIRVMKQRSLPAHN